MFPEGFSLCTEPSCFRRPVFNLVLYSPHHGSFAKYCFTLTSVLENTHQCHKGGQGRRGRPFLSPLSDTKRLLSGIWFVRLLLALSFPLGLRSPVSETKMLGDPVSAVSYGLRLALSLFILHCEPSALAGAPATVCPNPVRPLVFSAHTRFSLHHPTQMAPFLGAF